jgi:DNA-binding transcriptional LysR family regulator
VVAAKQPRGLPAKYDFRDIGWIVWAGAHEMVSPYPELAARVPDFRPAFMSDNYSVQVAVCRAGVGAMILLKTSHRLKRRGELVERKLELPTSLRAPQTIIRHKRMVDLRKVKIVVDLLRQEFADLMKSQHPNPVVMKAKTPPAGVAISAPGIRRPTNSGTPS